MSANSDARQGITLMEVIIALAIFAGSVLVLSRLIGHGTDAIEVARLETGAALIAESKLNEVTAGVLPLSNQSGRVLTQPQWRWSLRSAQGPGQHLRRVRVTVFPDPQSRLGAQAGDFRFVLERWVFVAPKTRRVQRTLVGEGAS